MGVIDGIIDDLFPTKKEAPKKIVNDGKGSIQQREEIHMAPKDCRTVLIPLDLIIPNTTQPRKFIDQEKLKDLAESIKKRGLLQPILVTQLSENPLKYQIIAGERRFEASKLAGLPSVLSIIKNVGDTNMPILALLENIHREDLNITEKTKAIGQLAKAINNVDLVASELGLSQRIVERYLRIYRVIYSSPALSAVFEHEANSIDFKIAENMATLFEHIEMSESSVKFFELVKAEGIKAAIKHFMNVINHKAASRRISDFYNIVVRKNELIFTVRYQKNKEMGQEDMLKIEGGLRTFFDRLKKLSERIE